MENQDYSEVKEYLEKNPDIIKKISEAQMKGLFNPIKAIYIDLVLLKDTRLGLMFGLADQRNNEEMKQYLIDNLAKYNNSPTRKFTTAYPDFMYNEPQLEKLYNDASYSDLAFDYAPDTVLSGYFSYEIDAVMQQNSRSEYNGVITVILNTYPLAITASMIKYARLLEDHFRHRIKIQYIRRNVRELTPEFWKDKRIVYCDDLKNLVVKGAPMCETIMHKMEWSNHRLIAPYTVDDCVIKHWEAYHIDYFDPKTVREEALTTEMVLSMAVPAFEFKYFNIPLDGEESDE